MKNRNVAIGDYKTSIIPLQRKRSFLETEMAPLKEKRSKFLKRLGSLNGRVTKLDVIRQTTGDTLSFPTPDVTICLTTSSHFLFLKGTKQSHISTIPCATIFG